MDLITHDFQVPVRSPDDILELLVWLPLRPNHHKVVHWFSSRFVSCNDIHVPQPNRRVRRESTFPSRKNSAGQDLFLVITVTRSIRIVLFVSLIIPFSHFFQLVLLFLALVSVPCMLLPKQFILKKQHEAVRFFHFSLLVST